jgi:hypothetical protein
MRVAPRFAQVRGPVAALTVLCAVAACGGGSEPMSSPGDKPDEITAEPKQVNVCRLLHPVDVTQVLGLEVSEVSLQYGAAQVPTLACGLGSEFGVPEVTVQLATGPISTNVFEDAYGRAAGGDPEFVEKLGESAFFRNEPETLEVHALVNGAILTINLANDPADPREKKDIVELARLAADRLPANPRLAPTSAGAQCAQTPDEAITAAIGTTASVTSSLADEDGSLMCSWSSRPGSVVISILRSPQRIASYRRLMDDNLYATVDEVKGGDGILAVSRTDKAGDLLIFDGNDAMAVINVVPTAGFSDASVFTTPGEVQLANGVVESVL